MGLDNFHPMPPEILPDLVCVILQTDDGIGRLNREEKPFLHLPNTEDLPNTGNGRDERRRGLERSQFHFAWPSAARITKSLPVRPNLKVQQVSKHMRSNQLHPIAKFRDPSSILSNFDPSLGGSATSHSRLGRSNPCLRLWHCFGPHVFQAPCEAGLQVVSELNSSKVINTT